MNSLKIALWITAIGCLTAVPFIFLPWSVMECIGSWYGMDPLPNAPIIIYSCKVVLGVFGLIGVFFAMLALDPFKYGAMLKLGTYGLILFGILALICGLSIGLPPVVYLGDSLSGLILGFAILFFSSQSKQVPT